MKQNLNFDAFYLNKIPRLTPKTNNMEKAEIFSFQMVLWSGGCGQSVLNKICIGAKGSRLWFLSILRYKIQFTPVPKFGILTEFLRGSYTNWVFIIHTSHTHPMMASTDNNNAMLAMAMVTGTATMMAKAMATAMVTATAMLKVTVMGLAMAMATATATGSGGGKGGGDGGGGCKGGGKGDGEGVGKNGGSGVGKGGGGGGGGGGGSGGGVEEG
jgi:hypothetical protein